METSWHQEPWNILLSLIHGDKYPLKPHKKTKPQWKKYKEIEYKWLINEMSI